MAENSKTSLGVITQIVGAVLDIRFQDGNLPEINEQSTSNDRMGISL